MRTEVLTIFISNILSLAQFDKIRKFLILCFKKKEKKRIVHKEEILCVTNEGGVE